MIQEKAQIKMWDLYIRSETYKIKFGIQTPGSMTEASLSPVHSFGIRTYFAVELRQLDIEVVAFWQLLKTHF